MNIYYERQEGGLCRKHSINAFLGGPVIDTKQFHNLSNEFDAYSKKKFKTTIASSNFDFFNADGTNLVSYILRKQGIYTRVYMIGDSLPYDLMAKSTRFLVFNISHIWCVLNKDRCYKVDSIGGVTTISVRNIRNCGILLPVPIQVEWEAKLLEINNILGTDTTQEYLQKNKLLGDIEVPLCTAFSILELNSNLNLPEFKKI